MFFCHFWSGSVFSLIKEKHFSPVSYRMVLTRYYRCFKHMYSRPLFIYIQMSQRYFVDITGTDITKFHNFFSKILYFYFLLSIILRMHKMKKLLMIQIYRFWSAQNLFFGYSYSTIFWRSDTLVVNIILLHTYTLLWKAYSTYPIHVYTQHIQQQKTTTANIIQ